MTTLIVLNILYHGQILTTLNIFLYFYRNLSKAERCLSDNLTLAINKDKAWRERCRA